VPTWRKQIARAAAALNPAQIAFLYDEPAPNDMDAAVWVEHSILTASHRSPDDSPMIGHPTARQLWREHGSAVLAAWIRARPGTRPAAWWRCDAPEPRRRLAGVGEPKLNGRHLGVPAEWFSVDPENPPLFESEPAFLRRHGLLQPGEVRRLKPGDFEPVPITEISRVDDA
jgi:hypothetical protein